MKTGRNDRAREGRRISGQAVILFLSLLLCLAPVSHAFPHYPGNNRDEDSPGFAFQNKLVLSAVSGYGIRAIGGPQNVKPVGFLDFEVPLALPLTSQRTGYARARSASSTLPGSAIKVRAPPGFFI